MRLTIVGLALKLTGLLALLTIPTQAESTVPVCERNIYKTTDWPIQWEHYKRQKKQQKSCYKCVVFADELVAMPPGAAKFREYDTPKEPEMVFAQCHCPFPWPLILWRPLGRKATYSRYLDYGKELKRAYRQQEDYWDGRVSGFFKTDCTLVTDMVMPLGRPINGTLYTEHGHAMLDDGTVSHVPNEQMHSLEKRNAKLDDDHHDDDHHDDDHHDEDHHDDNEHDDDHKDSKHKPTRLSKLDRKLKTARAKAAAEQRYHEILYKYNDKEHNGHAPEQQKYEQLEEKYHLEQERELERFHALKIEKEAHKHKKHNSSASKDELKLEREQEKISEHQDKARELEMRIMLAQPMHDVLHSADDKPPHEAAEDTAIKGTLLEKRFGHVFGAPSHHHVSHARPDNKTEHHHHHHHHHHKHHHHDRHHKNKTHLIKELESGHEHHAGHELHVHEKGHLSPAGHDGVLEKRFGYYDTASRTFGRTFRPKDETTHHRKNETNHHRHHHHHHHLKNETDHHRHHHHQHHHHQAHHDREHVAQYLPTAPPRESYASAPTPMPSPLSRRDSGGLWTIQRDMYDKDGNGIIQVHGSAAVDELQLAANGGH